MNVCTGFSHKHGGMNLDRSQKNGGREGGLGNGTMPKTCQRPSM